MIFKKMKTLCSPQKRFCCQ